MIWIFLALELISSATGSGSAFEIRIQETYRVRIRIRNTGGDHGRSPTGGVPFVLLQGPQSPRPAAPVLAVKPFGSALQTVLFYFLRQPVPTVHHSHWEIVRSRIQTHCGLNYIHSTCSLPSSPPSFRDPWTSYRFPQNPFLTLLYTPAMLYI